VSQDTIQFGLYLFENRVQQYRKSVEGASGSKGRP
jgi:hypothetical protein